MQPPPGSQPSQNPEPAPSPPPPPGYSAPPPPPGYGAPGSAPEPPPGYGSPEFGPQAPPPPLSRGPSWGRIFGFGCLGCVLVLVIGFVWLGGQLRGALQRTPLTEAQQVYVGSWSAPGGVRLTIRGDGSGDVRDGGKRITNGRVTVDEPAQLLQVELFGLKSRWRIDTPPTAESRVMVLDGTQFTDLDAPGQMSPPGDGAGPGSTPAPPEAESATLAKESLVLFQQAVQTEDFTSLRSASSTALQKTYSAEQLRDAFKVFLENKSLLDPITRMEPRVETAAVSAQGQLKIKGSYDVTPSMDYEVSYIQENGAWKLLGINVNRKLE